MTRRDAAAVVALLVLGGLAFGQVLQFDFISWDDPSYVTENGKVLRGLRADNVAWAFSTLFFANWHPLTWLSHMAVVSAAGTDAAAHHAVNLALHLLNSGLCYLFLARATGERTRAFLVAALFAVHPVHAETVAWISDRKGLLAVAFMWLTVIAYVEWYRHGGARRYAMVLVAAAAAMLSKPSAIVLGGLLLVVDFWPLGRWPGRAGGWPLARRLLVEKLPILLMGAALAGVTLVAQGRAGATVELAALPLSDRLLNALLSWGRYLGALAWPGERSFFYPFPDPWPWPATVVAALALGVSAGFAWRLRTRTPAVLAGWVWLGLLLLPVLGLVQVGSQAMADRYLYFASVGIFVALAWLLPLAHPRLPVRRVVLAAAGAWVLLLTLQARDAVAVWQGSARLYSHALTQDQNNPVAHALLADLRIDQGDVAAAARHAEQALRQPLGGSLVMLAETVRGRVALLNGDAEGARTHLLSARAVNPNFHEPLYWLGEAALLAGQLETARDWYTQALRSRPVYPEAFDGLARVAWLGGDAATAQRYWQTALAADARQVEARVGLAVLHAQHGDVDGWARWTGAATQLDARRAAAVEAGLRALWARRPASPGDR